MRSGGAIVILELMTIFVRTIFIYFTVFLMLRIMGKREIGKLSLFDLVISIMIAEIAVFILEDPGKSVIGGLVPMVTLVAIQLVLSYITMKNVTIRRWFDGSPSYVIEHGKINRKEMWKQRYNLSDLLLQLRQSNVYNVADVEFAILETTGKLTVVTKEEVFGKPDGKPGRRTEDERRDANRTVKTNVRFSGIPLPLIMDGYVLDENLRRIGETRFWLKSRINELGASEFRDVFLCMIDQKGNLHIELK